MPLNLYRRHQQDCEGGHPEDSRSGEHEERSKKWKRCGCLIYAAGSLSKTFKRRKTGQIDWDEARAVAARWESAGIWDASGAVTVPVAPKDSASRVAVERAVKSLLDGHEKHSAHNTRKQYGFILAKVGPH
jgi:hypothetical protein